MRIIGDQRLFSDRRGDQGKSSFSETSTPRLRGSHLWSLPLQLSSNQKERTFLEACTDTERWRITVIQSGYPNLASEDRNGPPAHPHTRLFTIVPPRPKSSTLPRYRHSNAEHIGTSTLIHPRFLSTSAITPSPQLPTKQFENLLGAITSTTDISATAAAIPTTCE